MTEEPGKTIKALTRRRFPTNTKLGTRKWRSQLPRQHVGARRGPPIGLSMDQGEHVPNYRTGLTSTLKTPSSASRAFLANRHLPWHHVGLHVQPFKVPCLPSMHHMRCGKLPSLHIARAPNSHQAGMLATTAMGQRPDFNIKNAAIHDPKEPNEHAVGIMGGHGFNYTKHSPYAKHFNPNTQFNTLKLKQ